MLIITTIKPDILIGAKVHPLRSRVEVADGVARRLIEAKAAVPYLDAAGGDEFDPGCESASVDPPESAEADHQDGRRRRRRD